MSNNQMQGSGANFGFSAFADLFVLPPHIRVVVKHSPSMKFRPTVLMITVDELFFIDFCHTQREY